MKQTGTDMKDPIINRMETLSKNMSQRCQMEKRKMAGKYVHEMNFKVEYDKSAFSMLGILWIIFWGTFLGTFAQKLDQVHKWGELFDLSSYSLVEIGLFGGILVIMMIVTIFTIACAIKPMPRILNTSMYYRGKQYHHSDITKLVVKNQNSMMKVYLNGKYRFWISQDYINYWSFIKWAENCKIPIEGNTSVSFPAPAADVNFETRQRMVNIIIILIVITMIVFAVVFGYPGRR